jgi:Bacteriodetes cell division protein (FtsL-like)
MNTLKEKDVIKKKAAASAEGGKSMEAARKYLGMVNIIGRVDKQMMFRIMPFIFFLMALSLAYIANSYVAERTIRDIDKTSKDIKELRSEYISVKSDLMFKSRQSQVAKEVLPLGVKHLIVPPKKIILKSAPEK